MPRIQRTATVTWEGTVARGSGLIATESSALSGVPYSLAARIGQERGKTNPEELLGAAHAGCFSMSLVTELAQAGMPPEQLEVTATIVLDQVDGGNHRIVSSHLEARARVPGDDEDGFAEAVRAADEGCPFSALIKASADVTVNAKLLPAAVGVTP